MIERNGLQPVDTDVDVLGGFLAAGQFEILATRRAAADEDGVPVLRQQRLHAVDLRVVADIDAHVDDHGNLFVQHAGRQAERRDVGSHQAAGLIELFKDGDVVAERHEVVGDAE